MRPIAVHGVALALLAVSLCVMAASRRTPLDKTASPPRSTVDRIRSAGNLTCGGVPRPGLDTLDGGGRWSGLEIEICRAVAIAVFGPDARISWHSYESDIDFERVRAGADRLSFLTFAEMAQHNLTAVMLPGPTVFAETYDLLVTETSPAKQPADLAGQGICFITGTAAENSLESWFRDHKLEFGPRAFQEDDEMHDAFAVRRCTAMAGESTTLAAFRRMPGTNGLACRLLPDHLGAFPVMAATLLQDDAQWTAIVVWTLDTLVNADMRQTPDQPSGLRAMAVGGEGLGLAPDWQTTVVEAVGSYSAVFRRTLGEGSPLRLPQGLNRTWIDGGAFLPPQRN